MSDLKDKISKGIFWGSTSNGVQQLLNFLFGIFLARLLSPSDYGMVGMLTIFSAIASSIQESGFTVTLVNKEKISQDDYNSVFWFSLFSGLLIYLILFFSAPLIAKYFHTPELVKLSRYVFLSFFINSFCISQNAYLVKAIQIRKKAIATMISVIISGITGIILAYYGFSYWGIATQQLVYSLVLAVLYNAFSDWKPSFHISFKPAVEMLGFSFKLLLTSLFNIFNLNILSVILGRYYTKTDVGFYNQGKKWASRSMETLVGTLRNICQPALVESNNDLDRQLRVFRKFVCFTSFITFPALFCLALIAPELITATITEKWAFSAKLLSIISVGNAFVILETVYSYLILAKKDSNIYMWNSILLGIANVVVMFIMSQYGILAMVISNTLLCMSWIFVYFIYAKRTIGYKIFDSIRDISPYLIISIILVAATYFSTCWITNVYVLLIARVLVFATLYCLVMYLLHSVIFMECVSYLRNRIRKM